jgi:SNF2 family DNA or RNA helicase
VTEDHRGSPRCAGRSACTPLENHTGELWSIFAAVAPGLLPSADDVRARFQLPIDRDRDIDRRRALARLVRPFLLRRTKAEVAPELPPRTEITLNVARSPRASCRPSRRC